MYKKIIRQILTRAILKVAIILLLVIYNTLSKAHWPLVFVVIVPLLIVYEKVGLFYLFVLSLANDITLGIPLGVSAAFALTASLFYKKYLRNFTRNAIILNYKYFCFLNTTYCLALIIGMLICGYNFYMTGMAARYLLSFLLYALVGRIAAYLAPRYSFI